MKNNTLIKCLVALVLSWFCLTAFATNTSKSAKSGLVGTWTTFGEKSTHAKPRSIVRLWEYKDQVYGKILKVYPQPGDTGRCVKCPGEYHNKRIKGMTFIWNLQQNQAKPNEWVGGRILDPKNGKVYRCKMTLIDHGKRLKVRGYIGISLLGRTQIWKRRVQ